MRLGRLDLLLFFGLVGTLVVVLLALERDARIGIALAVLVGLLCLASLARVRAAHVGAGFVVLFAFTASWDHVELAGTPARYLFLLFGLAVLALVQATKQFPPIPWWVHAFALTVIVVTALQTLLPVSQSFLDARYLTSDSGVALGTRPEVLPALSYLLVNVYLVPAAVVMAVMAVPKSLRTIIAAYVMGVAVSCLAAYLGFIGIPFLADLLVAPVPSGVRASGYTSHPLHLATSAVMAIALAVWMAVQPGLAMRWFGRFAVVAIALGLYASGSRGGNVAGTIAVALCVLLLPAIRKRWHVVAAVAASGVALVFAFVPTAGTQILRTTRVVGDAASQSSDFGRGELFQQAMTDFAESPIYGIGTRYLAEAHLLYAGVLASGGVLLFFAYVLFNIGSFRDAFRASTVSRSLGGALAATLVASLAYWTVADEFTGAIVQAVYGILIATVLPQVRSELAAVLGSPAESPPSDDRSDGRANAQR